MPLASWTNATKLLINWFTLRNWETLSHLTPHTTTAVKMELAFTMEGLSLSMETNQALFLIDLNLWEKKKVVCICFSMAPLSLIQRQLIRIIWCLNQSYDTALLLSLNSKMVFIHTFHVCLIYFTMRWSYGFARIKVLRRIKPRKNELLIKEICSSLIAKFEFFQRATTSQINFAITIELTNNSY